MQAVTRALARYICSSRYGDLPAGVRHEGERAFVNFVGCAAGGALEDDVQIMVDTLAEFNGAAAATIIGRRERLDALNATFINSMSSSALAFNDTHYASVAHPTSPVAAALLALAERQPVTGEQFVHALVLGVEIQCRVGNILCAPPAQSAVGLSMQGMVGSIGAAVATAKCMGLDENAMVTALGHAANQSSGLRQAQSTMGSHYTPGHAARCGFMASLLASRGFNCCDNVFEGPKGFAVSFATGANPAVALDRLGEAFEISGLAYKPYPSGFVIHPVIDACLDLAKANVFAADDIERVELLVNPLTPKLTDIVAPRDRGQALVSFQHWAAVSLLHKAAGIAQITEAMVHDPVISALRPRITATSMDSMGREAATVRVALKNGKRLEASIADCRGSAKRPMTDEDISVKTLDQLRMVFPADRAERILDQSWKVGSLATVDPFCKQLAAS
jgi:2-methylcitrate dehydratase PrpD